MPCHGRSIRRLASSFAAAATTYAAAATVLGWPASAMPADTVDAPTPCWSDQIAVSASPTEAAVGHRAVTLIFTLAGGAEPCTIAGYAGVDSGAGGPLVHARPTLRGYMGGLPSGVNVAPAVILSISTQGQAIVEGVAVDGEGKPCPTYTDLLVNPPGTTNVVTVSATIEACELQVHPVTAV
ncbi:DUF4232 domain-containing protein [Mycobacterium intracellulare]|uniref:DUF4232 domain-containing protein n=1 Tax=Mycobacterium intracellulare TaxID=1767 RepID=UPI001EEEA7D2|nr:DUF4232 domain-containing protein [Mycobacterium intracellulare]MEE3752286.1 DUF4232 domain-containing protein [Mycobacterium intracellulare]